MLVQSLSQLRIGLTLSQSGFALESPAVRSRCANAPRPTTTNGRQKHFRLRSPRRVSWGGLRRQAEAQVILVFLNPAFVVLLDPDAARLLALSLALCIF